MLLRQTIGPVLEGAAWPRRDCSNLWLPTEGPLNLGKMVFAREDGIGRLLPGIGFPGTRERACVLFGCTYMNAKRLRLKLGFRDLLAKKGSQRQN